MGKKERKNKWRREHYQKTIAFKPIDLSVYSDEYIYNVTKYKGKFDYIKLLNEFDINELANATDVNYIILNSLRRGLYKPSNEIANALYKYYLKYFNNNKKEKYEHEFVKTKEDLEATLNRSKHLYKNLDKKIEK